MMAGAVVYSGSEEEESDSGNILKEAPTGLIINWMCGTRGRLALCSIANLLAHHASPASVPSLRAHTCSSLSDHLGSSLSLALSLLLLHSSHSPYFRGLL